MIPTSLENGQLVQKELYRFNAQKSTMLFSQTQYNSVKSMFNSQRIFYKVLKTLLESDIIIIKLQHLKHRKSAELFANVIQTLNTEASDRVAIPISDWHNSQFLQGTFSLLQPTLIMGVYLSLQLTPFS